MDKIYEWDLDESNLLWLNYIQISGNLAIFHLNNGETGIINRQVDTQKMFNR